MEIHELFNLAQMLQGENLPANIAELRRCIEERSRGLSGLTVESLCSDVLLKKFKAEAKTCSASTSCSCLAS